MYLRFEGQLSCCFLIFNLERRFIHSLLYRLLLCQLVQYLWSFNTQFVVNTHWCLVLILCVHSWLVLYMCLALAHRDNTCFWWRFHHFPKNSLTINITIPYGQCTMWTLFSTFSITISLTYFPSTLRFISQYMTTLWYHWMKWILISIFNILFLAQ